MASFGRAETTFSATQSDVSTSNLASTYFVSAYQSSPKLLFFKTTVSADSTYSLAIDLRKDDINVIAPDRNR